MSYVKPWKNYADQLDKLIARGMVVNNCDRALDCLERIGYYRLSGYWFAFRERSGLLCLLDEHGRKSKKPREESIALDAFRVGTTFQNAVDLYVFDKQLRLLVMDALERIEIALRADISHSLGQLDRFAYLRPELFHDEFSVKLDKYSGVTRHHEWLGKHAQLIGRSKEEFVKHNRTKYGLPLAIWIACEVWNFGTLSTLFNGMREAEQDKISARYGVSNGRVFATWLRSLNYLRNICAHHSRLWNRNIVDQPKLPSSKEVAWVSSFEVDTHARARCFLLLKITQHLLGVVNPRSSWPVRMREHLQAFPDLNHLSLSLAGMGVYIGWEVGWRV